MIPWLDEVEDEDDWRWRLIDGDDGNEFDGVVFACRGRSVREPVWINVVGWIGEVLRGSCSLHIRGRFINPIK